MTRPPTQGVAGAKPRLPNPIGNGGPSKEELARLSHEYLEIRNRGQAAKAAVAQMELARRMGELIPRKTVFDTLAHYMVVFRQRSLLLHRSLTQRLITLNLIDEVNSHAVSEVIEKEIRSLLNELGYLPQKATDPNWIAQLEREELGLSKADDSDNITIKHRQTPKDHQAAQARIEKRRAQKAAAMRKVRERG